jgi:hypothetical protein
MDDSKNDEIHLAIESEERAERFEVDGYGVVDREDSEDEWVATHDAHTNIEDDENDE